MRIVVISSDQYPFFVETINALSERGHEVHVFCSKEVGSNPGILRPNKNIIIHSEFIGLLDNENNRLNFIRIPWIVGKLKRKLIEISPDLLHAFNLKWSGWIAAMAKFYPFILTGLGSDILIEAGANKNIFYRYLRNLTVRRANIVTCVSSHMLRQVKEIQKTIEPILFFPGANPKVFFPKDPSIEIIKKYKSNNEIIIFSPRYIRPIYQTKEIVRAFAQVKTKIRNVKLLFGGSENDNPKYYAELRKLIDQLGLNDCITFIGRVNIKVWVDCLALSDVVVSYPFSDGMPATIYEAMAMKRPIVLSDVPSICEVMANMHDAIICNKNDVNSLSDALIKITTDEFLRIQIGENGYKTFNRIGNFENQVNNLTTAYSGLLNKNNNLTVSLKN
ncbi:glycosyltransferase family 4 protein [Bacteroidota bacterium]